MITIVTLGKTKTDYLDIGIKEYSKRISRFAKLKWVYLPDIKLTSTNNIKIVKEKEAEIILHYLKNDNAYKILLDEKGKELSSIEFANLINKKNFNISFIIGGVYGTADIIKQNVNFILSFSEMTFTHQMIRLFLAEQIYRAITIIKGKKYHY